jgi:hypothetical protein
MRVAGTSDLDQADRIKLHAARSGFLISHRFMWEIRCPFFRAML